MNRVVITGAGIISPLGNDAKTTWEGVREGRLGVFVSDRFDAEAIGVYTAGEVHDFDYSKYLSTREARRLDRFSQFAYTAASEAIEDSGIDFDGYDRTRLGVVLGSGMGGLLTTTEELTKLIGKGPKSVSPLFIPKSIINLAAGYISLKYDLRGPSTSVVSACASGTDALGAAFHMVRDGRCDAVLAGGSEAVINDFSVMGFHQMQALSVNRNPAKASRPFDRDRDGFVMGEGAGFLVLETYEGAKKRGANIIAEIGGYGQTCDANHITAPREDGLMAAAAMEQAVKMAGHELCDVDYINAHGTSTPLNDVTETKAINVCFKEHAKKLAVSSTKSMTGHLLGAAGAVEAFVAAKAVKEGFVPATIGLENESGDCDLDYVKGQGRNQDIKIALSNSFGFGGHNAVLLIKKVEE
jgi:3-oxoacyl-[acyl-carrier-protein] synthase II